MVYSQAILSLYADQVIYGSIGLVGRIIHERFLSIIIIQVYNERKKEIYILLWGRCWLLIT